MTQAHHYCIEYSLSERAQRGSHKRHAARHSRCSRRSSPPCRHLASPYAGTASTKTCGNNMLDKSLYLAPNEGRAQHQCAWSELRNLLTTRTHTCAAVRMVFSSILVAVHEVMGVSGPNTAAVSFDAVRSKPSQPTVLHGKLPTLVTRFRLSLPS
jgi:hypothetical protein